MNKYITDTLSDTTELYYTERTIRAYLDDKGNEFFTIYYNEDMLCDYAEIHQGLETTTVQPQDVQEIIEVIEERQKEL